MTHKKYHSISHLSAMKHTQGSFDGGWRIAKQLNQLSSAEKLHAAMEYHVLAHSRGISLSEYFYQYCFFNLSKQQQGTFITISEAQRITKKLSREIRDILWHKDLFLTAFKAFAHRDWVRIEPGSRDRFMAFCRANPRLIIKPRASTEGKGIRILDQSDLADPDTLFDRLLDEDCIAEEIMMSNEDIAAFHPASLNTIRVVTLFNGRHFEILGAAMRLGRYGSFVDNASAGGIFAAVDPASGKVVSSGMDMMGHRYDKHPDTGRTFRGFMIPQWDLVVETVSSAVKVLPYTRVAGWDVALLRYGGAALVEGNHMPDFDLLQSPLQIGIKQVFMEKVRRLFGESFLT